MNKLSLEDLDEWTEFNRKHVPECPYLQEEELAEIIAMARHSLKLEEAFEAAISTEEINKNPILKRAFQLSELENDNAPIGWSKYIPQALKEEE